MVSPYSDCGEGGGDVCHPIVRLVPIAKSVHEYAHLLCLVELVTGAGQMASCDGM